MWLIKTMNITHLCILCRGAKYLCGKAYCPIITKVKLYSIAKHVINSRIIFGSTPPSIFVGRIGYPLIFVGPLTPPIVGDTAIFDLPELWNSIPIEEILYMRMSLVLARDEVRIQDMNSRFVQLLHELILSIKPIDIEIYLAKPPKKNFILSDYEPPIGLRAQLETLRIASSGVSHKVIEKVYYDYDLRASEAIVKLYKASIPITHIQKLLSIGALGIYKHRKLVPTRWAITAVDDIVSRELIKSIRSYPEISNIQVFIRKIHKNLFFVILIPGRWSFEWMEAWFPKSTWNPFGKEVVIEGDYELYMGRKEYPSIGGCYYASRLAVAEYLNKVKRQAIAIVLREIYPGFDIPIGVWFVREQLRALFKQKPIVVDTLEKALQILNNVSMLGVEKWKKHSILLRKLLYENKIWRYLKID